MRQVERLAEAIKRHPAGPQDVLGWLEETAGNPRTYDAPDPTRKAVCARILPGTYARLQMAQRRFKLRTKAAAWEFLLRLGLAAAERMPAR